MIECACSWVGPDDSHDLEAQHPMSASFGVLFDPGVRESPEPLPFTFIDRVERMAESDAAPRLDLHEAEHIIVFRDDIEFTLSASPVAVYDVVAAGRQVVCGAVFTRAAEVVFGCHEDSMTAR